MKSFPVLRLCHGNKVIINHKHRTTDIGINYQSSIQFGQMVRVVDANHKVFEDLLVVKFIDTFGRICEGMIGKVWDLNSLFFCNSGYQGLVHTNPTKGSSYYV